MWYDLVVFSLFERYLTKETTYEIGSFLSNSSRDPKYGVSNRKKNVYLIALLYEFREMALTYFDLAYFIKKETAASLSVLTLYWHLTAPKHIFYLKIFAQKSDFISEWWEQLHWWALPFFKIMKLLTHHYNQQTKKSYSYVIIFH